MMTAKKMGYWLLVGFILLYSFFHFSPLYSNKYTSDQAVHVLMAHNFKWNHLYYWGQDRLGSFVPMLASFPVRYLGVSPIYAIAIVQYILLLGGFLFFSSFIEKLFLRLFLCILWFFPMSMFDVHLEIGHPYGAQLFFLGCSLYCFHRHFNVSPSRAQWLLFLSAFSFMLSAWISDLMIFLLPVYFGYVWLCMGNPVQQGEKLLFSFYVNPSRKFFFLLGGILLGFFFLVMAKKSVRFKPVEYDTIFSSLPQIKKGFGVVSDAWQETLLFKIHCVPVSFHAVFFTAIFILLIVSANLSTKRVDRHFYLRGFIFSSAVVSLLIVISSRWVELNGYAIRYFSFTYYLGLIFLVLMVDSIRMPVIYRITVVLFVPLIVMPPVEALINVNRPPAGSKEMMFKELKDLGNELGNCGILGDYWNTYNIASANPDSIVASPRDWGPVRNPALVPEIMRKKNIYLIADNWFSEFPSSCVQFGYFLKKDGDPFILKGLTFCRYKNTGEIQFPLNDMKSRYAHIQKNENILLAKNDSLNPMNDFIFFGPFVTLRPGEYHLEIEMGTLNQWHEGDTIRTDCTNSGGLMVSDHRVFALKGNDPFRRTMKTDFELKRVFTGVEFRLFLKGKSQVYLKRIFLKRKPDLR